MPSRVSPATTHTTSLATTQADNQVRQVITRLNMIYPNQSKLLALTSQFAKATDLRARKLEWGQQADFPRRVTVDGTTAANATTVAADGVAIHIDNATAVVAGQLLEDSRTNEFMRITTNTTGALVVVRGTSYGYRLAPLTVPSGTELIIHGAAVEENAAHANPQAITPELLYNFPRTFERVIAYSSLAKAIKYYLTGAGGTPAGDEIVAMATFKRDIERAAKFGRRAEVTGPGANKVLTAGGVEYYVDSVSNRHSAGGQFTYPTFQDLMGDHARVGGGGLYFGFACQAVMNLMQRWQLDYQRSDMMAGTTKTFGLDFIMFKGAGWRLQLFQDEDFEEVSERQQQLMVVKADNFRQHYVTGLGVQMHRGIESPENTGLHGFLDQLTATATFEVPIPEANMIVDDIAA